MPWITAVLEPPPALAHYNGPVIERVLPLAEARRVCGSMGARADACAWKKGDVCHIVIPTGGPVRDLGAYRRHEVAHCNGWEHGHDHGGGHGHAHGQSYAGGSVADMARANDPLTIEAQ